MTRRGTPGVKDVVKWLNSRCYRIRKRKTFGVATICKTVTITNGKTVCESRSIPTAKLDAIVTSRMTELVFQPERLATILPSLSSGRSEKSDAANARVTDEETKYGTMERTVKSCRPVRIDTHVEIFKREVQTSNI